MKFLLFLFLCGFITEVNAGPIFLRRFRRDFVPPAGVGGYPNVGGYTGVGPRILPQPDPLRPEHVDPNNPYLESMNDPYNPSYGLGVGYQQPFMLGGSANVPTGNIFHPTESVNGTFGYTVLTNVRFGTQGGPFYPWQDPKYAGSAKYLAMLQYQQQQQQAMLANAAAQQAMAVSNANSPTNPFGGGGPIGGGQSQNTPSSPFGGGQSQNVVQPRPSQQQMSAVMLATPPPLPARFSLL